MIAGPDGAPSVELRRAGFRAAPGRARPRRRPGHARDCLARGRTSRPRGRRAAASVTGTKWFPTDLRCRHAARLRPAPASRRRHAAAAPTPRRGRAAPACGRHRRQSLIGVVAPDEAPRAKPSQRSRPTGASRAAAPAGLVSLPTCARTRFPATGRGGRFGRRPAIPTRRSTPGPSGSPRTYHAAYVAHVPLEPRSALARWDGDQLTVWTATSTPFRARRRARCRARPSRGERACHRARLRRRLRRQARLAVALEAARLARAAGGRSRAVEPPGRVHCRLPAAGRAHRHRQQRRRSGRAAGLVVHQHQLRRRPA